MVYCCKDLNKLILTQLIKKIKFYVVFIKPNILQLL